MPAVLFIPNTIPYHSHLLIKHPHVHYQKRSSQGSSDTSLIRNLKSHQIMDSLCIFTPMSPAISNRSTGSIVSFTLQRRKVVSFSHRRCKMVLRIRGHASNEHNNGCRRRSGPWWMPIFGSIFDQSDPNIITSSSTGDDVVPDGEASLSDKSQKKKLVARSVAFTEEKAKRLRRELRETEIINDEMYHSAIASRLAFPDEDL